MKKTGAVKVPVFFLWLQKRCFILLIVPVRWYQIQKKEIETKYTQRKGNFMETKSFATRAEWKKADNPKKEGKHIIGLDLGYSGAKGFYENGYFCIPNFSAPITEDLFGSLHDGDIVYENLKTKKKYFVGKAAIESLESGSVVDESAMLDRNHYLSAEYLVLVHTSIGMALWDTKTDGTDVVIQTGLPPAYLREDEPLIRSVLEGEHIYKLTIGNESRRFHYTLRHDNVDVMRQPMGTYYSVVFGPDGKPTQRLGQFMKSNIIIFDGGFGTLDKFIIKNRGRQSVSDTEPQLGMKRVFSEARDMIEKDFNVSISIPAMQNCLETGMFQKIDRIALKTNEYPVNKYIEQANEMVREEAFDYIKNDLASAQFLIMSGGTGAAWYDYFCERTKFLKNLQVLEGNYGSGLLGIYSNARGYYMAQLQNN